MQQDAKRSSRRQLQPLGLWPALAVADFSRVSSVPWGNQLLINAQARWFSLLMPNAIPVTFMGDAPQRRDASSVMKTVFVLLSITLAGAPLAIAQGTPGQATLASHVNMEVDFHVYGPETDSPGSRVSGNVSTVWTRQNRAGDYPTGTAVYNGA